MKFWKMNGAGNDFLIINNLSGKIRPEQWPQIAQTVCERHRSVGADGLMAVEKSDSADYKMLFFNSDGSMGEMRQRRALHMPLRLRDRPCRRGAAR